MNEKQHKWMREDFLIALEVYFKLKTEMFLLRTTTLQTRPEVLDALELINSLAAQQNNGPTTLKSLMTRIQSFANLDEEYHSGGPQGSEMAKTVWDEHFTQPDSVQTEVAFIQTIHSKFDELAESEAAGNNTSEVREGQLRWRYHAYRERNRKIIMAKKKHFAKKNHGRLFCEVCKFDFAACYGELGEGFIECHHIKPVSELDGTETTGLDDLILLCANCHRMAHVRGNLTINELKQALK
jgi:5-methylcytosine-specific restriction protein A